MGRIIHVYCDESRQTQERFMVLGGIAVASEKMGEFNASIQVCRNNGQIFGEFKWRKVSKAKLGDYKKFIDCFFTLNNTGHAHFHSIIIDTAQIDYARFGASEEVGFYKFYYQLLLHCFGKAYAMKNKDNGLLTYLDYRNSSYSLNNLKDILNNGMNKKFEVATRPFLTIEPRDSKHCDAIQIVDLLIGAIGYKRNGFDQLAGASPSKKEIAEYIREKSGLSDITRNTGPLLRRFTIWNFRFPQIK